MQEYNKIIKAVSCFCLKLLFLVFVSGPGSSAIAGKSNTIIKWPDLGKINHVKGRAANKQDLKLHRAAFVLKLKGVPAGEPINIKIPQYAIHTDQATGEQTPVVIIQAEHIRKFQAYGYLDFKTGAIKVTYPEEIRLLGTRKPAISRIK